jgi:alkylation response protein AidB-like acyl-CoA dehydrogenase
MLDFTEEQKLAQQAIRGFCMQHIEPKVAAMEAGELSVYPSMRELADAFGIADMARATLAKLRQKADAKARGEAEERAGERPGGRRGGAAAQQASMMAILMMELSRVCPGFALAFGASLGLFGGAVMARGTLEQKEKWALPVLTLEKIGAWALTEPGAGSDAFGSMKTHAKRDGSGFRLSGSKTFITNAPFADLFVVYARMVGDGFDQGDVRAFIVERGAKGLATSAPMKKMGMHASPTGEVFLDDVFVPGDQLVGGERAGSARAAAKSSLANERFGMTPMLYGMVDRCLEESIRYAKQREQWGEPIANFQLVQAKIAQMFTAKTLMHALLMRQLESFHTGESLSAVEACAAKLYCAQTATACALEAVQLMGGAGYMSGSVVEMMARDAKLFQIGGGTDEIQMLRIARELLTG